MGKLMFNKEERDLIQRAKDLEANAKSIRKMASRMRGERIQKEERELKEFQLEDQRNRVDFTNRINSLVLNMSSHLKWNGMKMMDNSSFGVEKYKFVLVDDKTSLVADVWVVDGSGFQWSIR